MRLLDLLVSLIGLVFLSPFFLIIALMIKISSPGPVFYRALRIGKGGKPFRLYKFRSMIVNADNLGPGITSAEDSRITGVGRWMRKYKIDELPQLINVFKGDLSLVGPRPEDPRYVAQYTPEQRRILSVRPGITSAASLAFRKEEQMLSGPNWERIYCTEVLPTKLTMDLAYFSHRTLLSDILLIIRTILSIFH